MTILQNDFDRERIPVRRLAWYENVKRREKKKKIYFKKKTFHSYSRCTKKTI